MKWYNFDKIMSYNALFNFILTSRGFGKSYGAKKKVINNFLKKGEQFIYVRRYKTELKNKELFFKDISKDFPDVEFKVNGNKAIINGEVAGYFIALSTSQIEKSTPYPNVTTILYDEFIVDKGHIRYIKNEVQVFLDLYETVNRMRENDNRKPCKAIFLANNISLVNPYFIFFKCIPKNGEQFTLAKGGEVIVEVTTGEEYVNAKRQTRFGKLIEGTSYGNYAIGNETLRDSNAFIQPYSPKDARFIFSVMFRGQEVGIWISYKDDICYCSPTIQTSSKYRFTITKDDHDINYIMYNNLSQFNMFGEFVRYYKQGYVRFKDQQVKQHMFEIMQYMNIR